MKTLDFTAVDFETICYKPDRDVKGIFYICQIGLAIVRNGQIVEKYVHLVKPPVLDFDVSSMKVHHIHPKDVIDQPTFEELWPKIRHYFINTKLVAHNKSTEENILHRYLDEMGDMKMGLNQFDCTYCHYRRKGLAALCKGFGIPFDESVHHDALFDAVKCAELAVHMYANDEPDWDIVNAVSPTRKRNVKGPATGHSALHGDVLVKDLSHANPNNPFYDRKVVITGTFNIERTDLGHLLKSMGADVDTSITKRTNFVLVGLDPGPKKIEKLNKLIFDGYNIKKLDEFDLNQILAGVWEPYKGERVIEKNLDFTYEHFKNHHIGFDNGRNVIASKELFIGNDLRGDKKYLDIVLGNLGAFDSINLNSDTNICVLSHNTIHKLEQGIKDDTILLIEDFYNNNRAVIFDFMFLSEDDILDFCKERCLKCGDELTLGYLNKYLGSVKI